MGSTLEFAARASTRELKRRTSSVRLRAKSMAADLMSATSGPPAPPYVVSPPLHPTLSHPPQVTGILVKPPPTEHLPGYDSMSIVIDFGAQSKAANKANKVHDSRPARRCPPSCATPPLRSDVRVLGRVKTSSRIHDDVPPSRADVGIPRRLRRLRPPRTPRSSSPHPARRLSMLRSLRMTSRTMSNPPRSLCLPRMANTPCITSVLRHGSGGELPSPMPPSLPPRARRPSSAQSRSHHLTRAPGRILSMSYTTIGMPSRPDDRSPSHTPPSNLPTRPHHLQRSTARHPRRAYLAATLIRPDHLRLSQSLRQPFTIARAAFVRRLPDASTSVWDDVPISTRFLYHGPHLAKRNQAKTAALANRYAAAAGRRGCRCSSAAWEPRCTNTPHDQ
ncbi:hypothetical protein DFH09DRAFT_1301271 [Mycena vulgaris]|nr:hypothetical protein DFH09DRAFT_1301271 [Mycena vulgaris]